jgi:hypothetical protein
VFTLSSPAFRNGEEIPRKYTCDGADASPPLNWSGIPSSSVSLLLIMDDPDAPMGTFTHWILFNIPPGRPGLPEGVPKSPSVEGIGVHGTNDFGRVGYGGPCPPRGHGVHRYFFRLYALDTSLSLRPGARRGDVLKAIQGHVVDTAEYMGRYSRG